MNDLRPALEYLEGLVRKGSTVLAKREDHVATDYLLSSGTLVGMPKREPALKIRACDVDSFVAAIKSYRQSDFARTEVLVSMDQVIAVLDPGEMRSNRITLLLQGSEPFLWFQHNGGKPLEQKRLLASLRTTLRGTIPRGALEDIIRKVRIENGTVTTAERSGSKESFGRELIGTIAANAAIPEELRFEVPVFANPDLRETFPVRCVLEVDPLSGSFALVPFADELEGVGYAAVKFLVHRLSEMLGDDADVYLGTEEDSSEAD